MKESPFTPREKQVLRLLAAGHSSKDIADKLAITVRTAKTHRYRIIKTAGCHTTAQLIKRSVRKGWLERRGTR